eukprot:3505214-Pyramimonas_sp.AAC.2
MGLLRLRGNPDWETQLHTRSWRSRPPATTSTSTSTCTLSSGALTMPLEQAQGLRASVALPVRMPSLVVLDFALLQ